MTARILSTASIAIVWGCLGAVLAPAQIRADEVLLKNGMRFSGTAVPIKGLSNALAKQTAGPTNIYPILMVDTGMQRVYVPHRFQLLDVIQDDLARFEKFEVPQIQRGGSKTLQTVGGVRGVTPFSEFGRRTLTLASSRGPLDVVQGITEITPQHVTINALKLSWEHAVATTSVPENELDAVIRQVTDQSSPNDRMSIARFYIQASMYQRAGAELDSIARDFPEYKDRVEEAGLELRQLQAKQLLGELRNRQEAGQHRLAYTAAAQFPREKMAADVVRQVQDLIGEYDKTREKFDRISSLLGDLPAQLEDPKHIVALKPMRSIVIDQLQNDYEAFERLDAFLNQADVESLSADAKLALAYSGWVAGSANAIDNLDATLRLWDARFQMLEYLRSRDPNRRKELMAALLNLEGVGPQTVEKLIPYLPLPLAAPDARPGVTHTVQVTGPNAEVAVSYKVLLPAEYPFQFTPHHRYPLIVALRPAERTSEESLVWWGGTQERPGQAQRQGYIVIAPEYADKDQRSYEGDATAHYIVLRAIRDASKRFHVDSDRIFLAGHGMGGDAAFDIGMSHPDVFAGVVPITGMTTDVCKWYWDQAKHTAWYVVGGELDREWTGHNASVMNRMLRYGHDVIYVEYIGRGYESYYSEIHNIFEWMELHERKKFIDEIDAQVLRPTDNRHFWFRADDLPADALQSNRPMILKARVTPGNTIYVTSGAGRNTIWLSPAFVNFDERVSVRLGGRQRFNDFVRPDVQTLLDDLRIRGDRQQLYSVRLDLN